MQLLNSVSFEGWTLTKIDLVAQALHKTRKHAGKLGHFTPLYRYLNWAVIGKVPQDINARD